MAMETEYSVKEPLNREPKVKDLLSNFITKEGAYDRNHGPIPHLSTENHTLQISGVGITTPLTLSISDLETKFEQATIVAALQCAGNRRHTMRTQLKDVDGIDWGDAAVMNCRWKGPRLLDVLEYAGITDQKQAEEVHAAFACHAVKVQEDDWYGSSVPLARAMHRSADIILALKMNNSPLTHAHGAPIRVIAPGLAGARSVKWLDGITLQTMESTNHYQRRDYKILPRDATDKQKAEKYWDSTPALMDMPVNSVIGWPTDGEEVALRNGALEVRGYALPEGDQGPVVKIEVRLGEEGEWVEAEIMTPSEGVEDDEAQGKWAWKLWRCLVPKEMVLNAHGGQSVAEDRMACSVDVFSRATDAGGNIQGEGEWNLRGVAYSGYGAARGVKITL